MTLFARNGPETRGIVRNKLCCVHKHPATEVYLANKVSGVRSFNAKY